MKLVDHRNRQRQQNYVGNDIRDCSRHVQRARVEAVSLDLQIELLTRRDAVEVEQCRNDDSVKENNNNVNPDTDSKPPLR